ncbi:MAG: hypothetical protein HKN87_16525 [Saprospiraceae bacterium]|nr:hypothetical protein [Saprospiraceae bacterium]
MIKALLIISGSILIGFQFGCSGESSFSEEIHFYIDQNHKSEAPVEKLTYGLFINAPWENGGVLYLNFPEHLEYNPVGNTILRHFDTIPNPWIISPDRKQASYKVQSLALKDVYVESFSRVMNAQDLPADAQGVHVAMRISNFGSTKLPVIRPLICNQFKGLTGFPQRHHDFRHNYIVIDGQITSLADLPTENMDTEFKGCVVKACPQRDTRAERNGGLIEKDMDAALSIVTSKDNKRKLIIWWSPGKSMIANAFIPCIHADPYFGTLEPGEETEAQGLILFTEGEVEPIVDFLLKIQ